MKREEGKKEEEDDPNFLTFYSFSGNAGFSKK